LSSEQTNRASVALGVDVIDLHAITRANVCARIAIFPTQTA